MESTERAVVRLTEHHTEMTEGGPVEWPPLLVWLDNAVTEQVKRGQAGSGGAGSPINMGALALLQRIEHGIKQMREALYMPSSRDVAESMREAWEAAKTYRQHGELEDTQWERICDAFPSWVNDIEAEWDDRTRRMELTVPCPRCETRWVMEDSNGEDKRRAAVWVEYAEGRAPIAECRVPECAAMWVGWADVATLGFSLGAQQDVEVLAACGIDLSRKLAS